ncbi:MAG: AbrB/MazE/SpoVT family DNA-binding domain-containing protein [Candidatus Methanoperedens sp.]|nr:AbrB/MazE/SpoVT family DNA-binding domain-containing protein [Candidatus Methanoperedens sp.]
MTTCPICDTPMKKDKREIQKGIFAQVEVCPKCEDEWIDEKGYEALYNLFTRKTFKIGGSLAVRIPKEIADVIGLKEGSDVKVAVKEKKIIIEPA